MTASDEELDLKDRLSLIENMIAEGRRTTERWGWTFVLWGVAYYVAIAWSSGLFAGPIWSQHYLAWPVTMIGTCLLTILLAKRKHEDRPATSIGRAIGSIWMAMGISMFVLLLSLGMSGRNDQQVIIAIIAAMLGTTNAACSMILKWKAQFLCAFVWWAAAVTSLFCSVAQSTIVFLVAIFFCQIVFGIYGMIGEARERRQHEAAHA
jgi:fatty acid desaturase